MAVQEQTPLQEYTANGIAKQFDLEFDCESADHLIVSIDDLEVLHTDWYLSGNAIMFHVAPASGKQVKIQRNTPFNRIADYQSYNNSFRPPAINKDFDRIWWKLQELGVADWILSNRISALKAYVDDRDDELRAYLMEEIRKQGVALDQLDEYYNYLMQRLAQIAVDKGWEASFVVSAGGDNQQEINDRGGSYWREKPLGYDINSRVMLENGDIVKSTVANNTNDPNVDMAGWVNSGDAQFLYYTQLKEYAESTVGNMLNAMNDNKVYLMKFIPPSQHAAIYAKTSVYDARNAIASAVATAIETKATLILPECGRITFSEFPNIKQTGFKMVGGGSNSLELNYTGTVTALSFDAFDAGLASDQFANGLFLSGFHIKGQSFATGFFAQGVARSLFNDIMVNGSSGADGTIAFKLAGCMLNTFCNIKTSYIYGDLPYRGLQLTAGTRAGSSVGGCSNNLFLSCYAEGNSIGWQIAANGGDQNTFINGSPEACTSYGLVIGTNCRYNTFIGVGMENKDAVNGDCNDAGVYSTFIGCYSSNKFLIGGASKGSKIDGGFFERLEIQTNARATFIDRVTVNHWNTGSGGLINNGVDADIKRVTDSQTGEFISAYRARTSLTVGTSPFTFTNTYQVPVKIRVQGGTVTQALIRRGTDSWIEANPSASGGGTTTVGTYILMPQDKVDISFSVAPVVNLILM